MTHYRLIICLILSILFTQVPFLESFAGPGNGGGGVGVRRNGKFLTFAEAKVELHKPLSEVPGMNTFLEAVDKMPLTDSYKGLLKSAVVNGGDRKYYKLSREDLNADLEKTLLSKFAEVVKVSNNGDIFELAAITLKKDTFLLPAFFELEDKGSAKEKQNQMAAILFHEGLRVVDPDISYETIADAEVTFEQWLEAGKLDDYDSGLYQVLGKSLKDPYLDLVAAQLADYRHNRLKLLLLQESADEIGKAYYERLKGLPLWLILDQGIGQIENQQGIDKGKMANRLLSQIHDYPEIATFKALYNCHSRIFIFQYSAKKGYVELINNPPSMTNAITLGYYPPHNLKSAHEVLGGDLESILSMGLGDFKPNDYWRDSKKGEKQKVLELINNDITSLSTKYFLIIAPEGTVD